MASAINESRIPYLFEAVHRGAVRAAADSLNVAPSAVSRQIALLEQELATPLIERHSRGIRPTEAGALLIAYYREQRSHQADLLAKIQEVEGLRRGAISVVLGEGFVSSMVGGPMAEFSRRYPEIILSIEVLSSKDAIRKVVEDEADLALVFNPPNEPKVVSRACSQTPLQAIVGPNFPLPGGGASVRLADLLPYPAALMYEAFGTRQLVEAAAVFERIRLPPTITTNSLAVLKSIILGTESFTLVSPLTFAAELAVGQLRAIPVDNPILQNSEAHLLTRVGRTSAPAATRLLQLLTTHMRR